MTVMLKTIKPWGAWSFSWPEGTHASNAQDLALADGDAAVVRSIARRWLGEFRPDETLQAEDIHILVFGVALFRLVVATEDEATLLDRGWGLCVEHTYIS